MRLTADPPADAVVAAVVAEKGAAYSKKLFDALTGKIDLATYRMPAAVQDFLLTHQQLPPWADEAQLLLAERFFLDHGPHFLLCLYHKSLPMLYACARGAQVLLHTGRMSMPHGGRQAFVRRIGQTGKFLLEVMQPQGLAGAGHGRETVLRVRLIHAAIRHFVGRGEWDEASLGKPINQEDLALTLTSFSVSMLDALQQLGLGYGEAEARAWMHAWQVVGHLLGIVPALVPEQVEAARDLQQRILQRQAAPSEAGTALTRTLIEFVEELLPGQWADATPRGLMLHLLEPRLAAMLHIAPPTGCLGRLLPRMLMRAFRLEERLDAKDGMVARRIHALSRRLAAAMVAFFQKQAQHAPRPWRDIHRHWEDTGTKTD